MAKRFIDTDMFRKPLVRSLQAPYKILWIYLLCECDHAGVWDVELDVAKVRLGMSFDEAEALSGLNGMVVQIDEGRKWWIPEFINFQYGTLNPDNKVHASVIAILSRYGIDPVELKKQAPSKPLPSPFQGAKDKDKDKDKSKDKEKEKDARDEDFETFYAAYPEKKAKADALKAWGKLDADTRAKCLPAILAQVKADHFKGVDGKNYIPYPATWLNQGRYDDEIKRAAAPVHTPWNPRA